MLPDNTIVVETKCFECGKPIQTFTETDLDAEMEVKIEGKMGWYDRKVVRPLAPLKGFVLCNECADRRVAERDSVQERSRAEKWKELCPEAYRQTEKHKLPSPTKLERVLQWKFGPKGLALIGATGKGKSRCAWKLMEREFLEGRSVACLDSKFSMEYARKISVSGLAAFDWIEEKMTADLLLLDDAMKVRLDNSGAELALFALIEERMVNNRPIILTTQDTGETLLSRMSSDRGAATVRRLRECCEIITFD